MGILQLYSKKEYFQNIDPQSFCQGQFCWIPTPHIDPIPRILDVQRREADNHDQVKFELREANQSNDFKTNDRNLPIKRLNLRSNEELMVHKAKKRPGIIISSKLDFYPEIFKLLKQTGKRHLQQDSILVVPCYSTESEDSKTGFPQEMVKKIRYLKYRQFFYYPAERCLTKEGVARFDRVQVVVSRDPSAIKPMDIALTEHVFNLFMGMFIYCITGDEDGEIASARSLIKDSYS